MMNAFTATAWISSFIYAIFVDSKLMFIYFASIIPFMIFLYFKNDLFQFKSKRNFYKIKKVSAFQSCLTYGFLDPTDPSTYVIKDYSTEKARA